MPLLGVCKYFSEGIIMARPNPIRAIMEAELPSITYQRRMQFRPSYADINYVYNICNRYLFDNRLRRPIITQGSRRQTWGFCEWENELQDTGSYTTIKLMDKWFVQPGLYKL
jgi:hypothetical protein